MAQTRIEHTFNCSPDTFWDEIFFNDEFNSKLYKEKLEFKQYELVSRDDGDAVMKQTIDVVPKLGDMPGPLKKVLGDGIGYKEEGVFDKNAKRYKVTIIPNKLADKTTIEGEMRCEPAGDGKCKRIFECKVVSKVFGVGGMLEKRVIADMEDGYDKGAKFTNEWIDEKGLAGK